MRQYGSFMVRWWVAGDTQRLHIHHVQSDTELAALTLAEALPWMLTCVGMADRAPPIAPAVEALPAVSEPEEQDDNGIVGAE